MAGLSPIISIVDSRCWCGCWHGAQRLGVVVLLMLWGCATRGSGQLSPKFGLDIHHRFSDRVRSIFPPHVDSQLPVKGTADYFAALAHRDQIHGRRLTSSSDDGTPLTFAFDNTTDRISNFGFLYYANVSVGTVRGSGSLSWYLVALDTGSNLFWLPCNCSSCVEGVQLSSGQELGFNIYSLNSSSTGTQVPCNSSICQSVYTGSCSATNNECPYVLKYLSANTSSSGYLVQDVLHLATDVTPSKPINANVTFGSFFGCRCGMVETGSFLSGGAPNGLIGLGIQSISVPSTLASKNITANSFSMCFRPDGTGRISFGDQGSSDQSETPFVISEQHPTYNTSITQISVGTIVTNVSFTAIFDSGTSFALLSDPVYTILTQNFHSQVTQKRVVVGQNLPFEYCYVLSSCSAEFEIPFVNLTMEGGAQFSATSPVEVFQVESGICIYCLAVVQSESINIIGENFMTGYRLVFDRERNVLGWKASNCSYDFDTTTLPISPQSSAVAPSIARAPSSISPSSIGPQATIVASNGSHITSGGASGLHPPPPHLKLCAYGLAVVLLQILYFL
ncbi:hypothetical protein Dimus_017409 [Dionaea muscipula]